MKMPCACTDVTRVCAWVESSRTPGAQETRKAELLLPTSLTLVRPEVSAYEWGEK